MDNKTGMLNISSGDRPERLARIIKRRETDLYEFNTPTGLRTFTEIAAVGDVFFDARAKLASLPSDATEEQIFNVVQEVVSKSSFKNFLVYGLAKSGGWRRKVCHSDKEVDPSSRYEGEGQEPTTWLASVVNLIGKDRSIIVGDVLSEKAYEEVGLKADPEVINKYAANSKGPREIIYLRVLHPTGGECLAVMVIHNLVGKNKAAAEVPERLLPTDSVSREKIINRLEELCKEIAPYLAKAQASGSALPLVPFADQQSADSFAPSAPKAIIRRATPRGGVLPTTEEMAKLTLPAKPRWAVTLYTYKSFKALGASFKALFRALTFVNIKAWYREKHAIVEEKGVKQFFKDLWTVVPKTGMVIRDMFFSLMPRLHSVCPGKYAFLVHPRDIEDVYRVFPFARYLPNTLLFEQLKYLPPINLSKMTGLSFASRKHAIEGNLLAMMLTPQHMLADPKFTGISAIGLTMFAQKLGIPFAGLGALMPSLTKYGLLPREHGIRMGITTGHAYTSLSIANMAIVIKNLINPTAEKGELIAVVGAAGSTGKTSAKVLVAKGEKKLLLIEQDLPKKREALDKLKAELMEMNPEIKDEDIILSYNLADISQARIIVTVTNAPKAIIEEKWLRPGMIFIDDAQPPNVSEELAVRRQDIRVLKVLAHVPGLNPGFDFGLGTDPSVTFTCLAEVATVAMHGGRADDFTIGWPELDQ
ncbi:MAG: hypothetical protein KJ811_05110, partial [Candidatus Margulisbacteria bacterium]|nr:hypothetical protein [Candidatus Margulisiibacteriota bacterium]